MQAKFNHLYIIDYQTLHSILSLCYLILKFVSWVWLSILHFCLSFKSGIHQINPQYRYKRSGSDDYG